MAAMTIIITFLPPQKRADFPTITALFFGQRMAKDYAGAAILVPYFLVTLIAIYLLAR